MCSVCVDIYIYIYIYIKLIKNSFAFFLELLYTCIQRLLRSTSVHCSDLFLDIWSGSVFQSTLLLNYSTLIIAHCRVIL